MRRRGRKGKKNTQKATTTVKTHYVLIDYENVHVPSLVRVTEPHFQVYLFLGPNNKRLPVELVLAMHQLRERAQYILLETPGANALDFHLAYYLGVLTTADPLGFFHIISKDTGFDSLIQHMKTRKLCVARSISIEAMPGFRPVSVSTVDAQAVVAHPPEPDVIPATVADLIPIAIEDLIKRKASKPRTAKTLLNTLHAKLGKQRPITDIEAVYQALIERGCIRVEGLKVSYALPVS
jgi:hypothetical protein